MVTVTGLSAVRSKDFFYYIIFMCINNNENKFLNFKLLGTSLENASVAEI